MREELTPCPFCGGDVKMEKNTITCRACGYTVLYDAPKWYEGEYGDHKLKRYQAIREAWNKRDGGDLSEFIERVWNSAYNRGRTEAQAEKRTEKRTETNACDLMEGRQMVEEMPTIEPERKKGRWIEYDNSHCECPFCHEEWSYFDNDVERFNYCPNCGADMGGGQDG